MKIKPIYIIFPIAILAIIAAGYFVVERYWGEGEELVTEEINNEPEEKMEEEFSELVENKQVEKKEVNYNIKYNSDGSINTSDWLEYRNEEYGFGFKYPQNWEIKNKSGEKISLVSPENKIMNEEIRPSVGYDLALFINQGPYGDKFESFESAVSALEENKNIKSLEKIPGEKISYQIINEFSNSYEKHVFLFNGNKIISVQFFIENSNRKIIESIINSIDLSVKENSFVYDLPKKKGWKAYDNKELGIYFEFPEKYTLVETSLTDNNSDENENKYQSGKRMLMKFEDCSKESCGEFYISAITEDYRSFFEPYPFIGGNLKSYCEKENYINNLTICEIKKAGNNSFIFESEFVNYECSMAFVTNFKFNNPNSKKIFPAIKIMISGLGNPIRRATEVEDWDEEDGDSFDPCEPNQDDIKQNLILVNQKNGLSLTDNVLIDDVEKIISSFK